MKAYIGGLNGKLYPAFAFYEQGGVLHKTNNILPDDPQIIKMIERSNQMSETKSYEDVFEDNRERIEGDVEDIPVVKVSSNVPFNVSPNYKGKNPKSPEELAKMYEERKAKREAKRVKVDGLYESNNKMVSHPSHYQAGKYEVIDIIKEVTKDMTGIFATDTGNALKYLCRWNKKGDPRENIEKCMWYCSHLLKELDANGNNT